MRLLQKQFVPVSLDVMAAARRRDAAADFLRQSGCVKFLSTGHVSVVTADGQTLGIINPNSRRQGLHDWLEQRLKEWRDLPEPRRQPGAVKVGELNDIDPNFATLKPPKGALIVRVTNRTMQRDDKGQPRYLRAGDFDKELAEQSVERFREPTNDFMWILKEEWQALIPADPKVGHAQSVPESLMLRFYGYHLNPNLGIQGSRAYSPQSVQAGKLTAIVEKVTADSIQLRLEGSGVLDAAGGLKTRLIYQPAVLGHVTYDRNKQAVTELAIVAFGQLSGRLHRSPETLYPETPRLLGVAFELILNPMGAELLRPNAARMSGGSDPLGGYRSYLNPCISMRSD